MLHADYADVVGEGFGGGCGERDLVEVRHHFFGASPLLEDAFGQLVSLSLLAACSDRKV